MKEKEEEGNKYNNEEEEDGDFVDNSERFTTC